jgi:GWxTD domain-containing protein
VNELGTTLAIDSVQLNGSGGELSGAVVRIPVTTVGLGVGRLRLWFPGTRDTVSGPLFVGFGEDLPVATFNDMLNYLQYYINPARVLTLRQAAEDQRASLWAAFLRDTDPVASTPQHEGLLAYFERIRRANDRFRGEATDGWLTDRGKVYVTLGEPDQLTSNSSGDVYSRNRTFAWDYQRYNLRLFFVDRTGLGRWTLDPSSEADFNSVAARERVGQ